MSSHSKNLAKSFHRPEVNCLPLSAVRVAGALQRATKCKTKASAQDLADISRRGRASNQRLNQSTIVKRYLWSQELGKGPTMFT